MPRPNWRGKGKTSSKSSAIETKSHDNAIALLSNVIGLLDTTADLVPLDVAKGVLSTLSSILTTVKNTMQNKDDFAEVLDRCEKIANSVKRSACGRPESDTDPTLVRALDELKSSVDVIEKTVKAKEQRALRYRVFSASVDRESIAKWKEQLDSFLRICDHELIVHIDMEIGNIGRALKEGMDTKPGELDREPPPGWPSMFFGRDDLVRDAVESLDLQHVVLVGPGGIGKSSIAKAILNEDSIVAKFQDRRFFVSFDNIDASQITLDTFVQRIADVLGVKSALLGAVKTYLAASNVLIVLDNAETFQDAASGSDRIAEAIDELGALPSVRIILTTRNRRVSTNLSRIIVDVPVLNPSAAREAFTKIYWIDGSPAIIAIVDELLKDLDFHALSINLLAHVATENQWTLDRLKSEWKKQQTDLLEVSGGKLQSVSVTIELSLASSSIKKLGNDARHVMQVAAFLPQGVNEENLEHLFPTIRNIRSIIDALCRLSLMYRKAEAYAMLSPIRIHILNTHQSHDTLPLDLIHVRNHYYAQLDDGGAWITTEDANVERLIAHDLSRATAHMELAYKACSRFLYLLMLHKPRPTSLRIGILGKPGNNHHFVDQREPSYWEAWSVCHLGGLAAALRNDREAIELLTTAKQLFALRQHHEMTVRCLEGVAGRHFLSGNLSACEETFQEALNLRREYHILSPDDQARINLRLGDAMMHKGRLQEALTLFTSAQEYFDSTGDASNIAWATSRRGEAEWHSGNCAAARQHFETRLSFATRMNDKHGHVWSLICVARDEARDGHYMEARKVLEEAFTLASEGNNIDFTCRVLWQQAALASDQGHFDCARDILMRAFVEMTTHGWQSVSTIAMTNDCSARNELFAGDYEKARELFLGVEDSCDETSDLELQIRSSRALGEIALLEGDITGARKWFTKTKSLCDGTGTHPDFLYIGNPHTRLKEEHNGWKLFLKGRLPSV
ncbi:TPR-like protein [Leucogyrophana mollusca]|uniref:TPR-like protein n=1 Tax=Leucogyrophana mollusca TaxID=85980 RepID=A0ACB8AZQ4_9AGAM|nr:TPR-like protein [Leucogyrophana mollusca]